MAGEDSNAKRRRELEEILELRRSFGTLGRRLVNRPTPIRSDMGPGTVDFLAQSAKSGPAAGAPPEESQRPEEPDRQADEDQPPEPYDESEPEPDPELDQEPELAQEPDPETEPGAKLAHDPEPDQLPDPETEPDPELAQDPEPDEQPDPASELDSEPDDDRVSTTVRRITPIVDESYHVQAQGAPVGGQPLRIPEPAPARPRKPWLWLVGLVGLVVVFALGVAVDRTVLQPSPQPAAPPASSQVVQAPSTPLSSVAPAVPQVSVPASCLVTAQRGDVLIDLLVRKTRGIEVTKALKAYTEASQTCRKEASSR